MDFVYVLFALLLWFIIGYSLYRFVRFLVSSIKNFVISRKESKNHENSEC